MIEEWLSESTVDKAALDAAIAQYKAGTIDADALDAVISEYAVATLDKTTIYAAVDAYDAANSALNTATNNNTLTKISESEYKAALKTFEQEKKTFSDYMESYILGKRVNGISATNVNYKRYWTAFQKALTEFNEAKAAYEVVEMSDDEAQTAYDDALAAFNEANDTFNEFVMGFVTENIDANELEAAIAAHESNADAYSMYIAATKAFNTLLSSGFAVDYQECFDTYLLLEKLSRYSTWGKVATAAGADPEAYECYMSYLAAVSAVSKLEKNVEPAKYGSLDNYAVALAQLDVLTELGYDKSDDAAKVQQYEKAQSLAKQARRSAITALAFTDAKVLRDLKAILEAAENHLVLATEAIDILALSEGVTIKYAEGQPKSVKSITNRDEIQSFIVGQAIDRAMAVYNYVMADSYTQIVDGRDTEYTLNGYALKTNRDSSNNTYYFYGTYETGYSYFTRNADGTFSVYHKGTFSGSKTAQGEEIYEYKEGNSKIYYTASLEKGYTYYTKGANDVYTASMPTVYDGVEVATLDDGTVIYKDGNVYYSVNEDGTYTRYTYQKSIKSCVDEAIPAMEAAKESADKLVELSSDTKIATDVATRIERNYLMSIKGEEIEEEEEDTNFKYATENIVAVTYGNDDGSAYKTVILNYNNYTVRVVYDDIEYTIPAHSFVEIKG